MELTPEVVKDIHTVGGSLLGSHAEGRILVRWPMPSSGMNIDSCFVSEGWDDEGHGIHHGGNQFEVSDISVIGIPKTIDNDLNLIQKTLDSIRPSLSPSKRSNVPMSKPRVHQRHRAGQNHGTPVGSYRRRRCLGAERCQYRFDS